MPTSQTITSASPTWTRRRPPSTGACAPPFSDGVSAYVIDSDGTVDYDNVYLANFAPRPAFNLKSSIVVSDAPGSDGCYTIESVPGKTGGLYVKNNGVWVAVV